MTKQAFYFPAEPGDADADALAEIANDFETESGVRAATIRRTPHRPDQIGLVARAVELFRDLDALARELT